MLKCLLMFMNTTMIKDCQDSQVKYNTSKFNLVVVFENSKVKEVVHFSQMWPYIDHYC